MDVITEGSKRTPKIRADFDDGIIEISGISLPENAYDYFLPLHELLDNYITNPRERTTLNFKMEYLNTGSALSVRNLILKLNNKLPKGTLDVNWFYELDDIDILETGQELASLFDNCTFQYIEVDEF
ncbi:DUF1987 domain-containing protein [Crocinitomix catalasitica]|uniref:DUF1987 domain-containing protein n=1 Tax=Crocinitomix catalasitica TaxID=184607 RepID=UPI00048063FD|nr:DUF1987 domain-containing protein [Crocinitomix catalasitica]